MYENKNVPSSEKQYFYLLIFCFQNKDLTLHLTEIMISAMLNFLEKLVL